MGPACVGMGRVTACELVLLLCETSVCCGSQEKKVFSIFFTVNSLRYVGHT